MTQSDRPDRPAKGPTPAVDPEQVAIALGYQAGRTPAPKVLATGRGHVAEQILQIAFSQGVKVRKDPDLALLLSMLDVDQEIPLEAFAAVAEILAYVYRANAAAPPLTGGRPQASGGPLA